MDRSVLAPVHDWFDSLGWEPFDFQRSVWASYLDGESGLLHAPTGTGKTLAVWMGALAEWMAERVRRAGRPPSAVRITYHEDPVCTGPFWLSHYPEPAKSLYTLAGHLHPGIVLHPQGGDRIRVPCFHFSSCVGVLPAFGAFTGLLPVEPVPEDRVYAVADDEVIRVQ